MFGQSSTPFGSPQGGFGQSNTGGFGSTTPSTFGAPTATSTGFRGFGTTPAPAPTGFGGFGQASAPTAFGGGTGGFGAPSPAPPFGTGGFGAPQSTGLFGTTTPAPAPTGGLFGSAPSAPSAFGTQPTTAFGGGGVFGSSSTTTPAFGSSTTSTSAFGVAAQPATTGGGLFGGSSPAPAPIGFGSTSTGFGAPTTNVFGAPAPATTGGLFGSTPTAPSGGLFGSTAPAGMPGGLGSGGTKLTPFQPTNRPDGTSNITLLSITAMQPYENKSFEELRYEDYSQGNKGTMSQTGAAGGFGAPSGFGGAPSPAPLLFGGAPAPAPFGSPAPATGGFGFGSPSPAPGPFGAPATTGAFGATGGFGAPPAAPSLFGSPTPAPGLFGSVPAPAPTGGLFGSAPAPSTGFGAPPAPAFGASPAPPATGLFGQPPAPAPSTGLFGSSMPSTTAFGGTGGAFGSTSLSGGFGTFGAPAPTPATGGLFGTTPAPAFGAPPAGGGLFGAPTPAPAGGGLFGAKPPGQTGFFGSQPSPGPGNFGMPPQSSFGGSSYGQYPQAPVMVAPPPVGSVMPPATNEIMASQLAALENKRKELEQSDNFRRKPTESATVTALSLGERESSTLLSPMRMSYIPFRTTTLRSAAKARPRGFASETDVTKAILGQQPLSKLGSGGKPMAAPETVAASSATRLIISPSPKPKLRLALGSTNGDTSSGSAKGPYVQFAPSPMKLANGSSPLESRLGSVQGAKGSIEESHEETPTPRSHSDASPQKGPSPLIPGGRAYEYYQRVIGAVDDDEPNVPGGKSTSDTGDAPILSKTGYSCSPSIATLSRMEPVDLAAVPSFTIQRPGVGKIVWEGAVDVRGADLDRIVMIEPKSVSVYTEEEERGMKPPVGTKLNRPAIITLEGVYPPEGGGPESDQKFVHRVAKQTKKMGAELIDYDPSTGKWILRVHHFSKYGLDDDDDDDSAVDDFETEPKLVDKEDVAHQGKAVRWDFQSGGREGRSPALHGILKKQRRATPYKPTRGKLFVDFNEDNNEVDSGEVVSDDVEMLDESQVLEDAEVAFNNLHLMHVNKSAIPSRKTIVMDDNSIFPDESATYRSGTVTKSTRYIYDNLDLNVSLSMPSITMKMATAASVSISSQTDYGLRMGRSFRVAWSLNGTLLRPSKGGIVLILARPKFSETSPEEETTLLQTQRTHCEKIIVNKESCPLLSLPTDSSGGVLKKTLESYSKTVSTSGTTGSSVVKNAFSLLLVLQETTLPQRSNTGSDMVGVAEQQPNEPGLDSRILHAIGCWLSDSCSADVRREVAEGKSKNESYKALLCAVSGGNLDLASSVAEECGHSQLSILLASGNDAKKDILQEIDSWRMNLQISKLPQELYRSYSLIAGDESMEESLCKQMKESYEFDWRRRMAMKLAYCTSHNMKNVVTLLEQYEADVSKGVAPFPSPMYASGASTSSVPSILFSLLKLSAHASGSTFSSTLNPLGYTQNPHDYSLSFHLAALISAMGCSKPLTSEDEYNLLDGFATQLLSRGYWYWSVYVTLFLLDSSRSGSLSWRIKSAKELVLRNYNRMDDTARQFLESLSVPSQWFEEALAYRCAMSGDTHGYLLHMIRVDTRKVVKTVEKILIPNTLFLNGEKLSDMMELLKALVSSEDVPLASAVLDLFQIYRTIQSLDGGSREEIDASIPALLDACDEVEETFVRQQRQSYDADVIEFFPDSIVVPMASFLAEGLSQISLFRLQVLALQSDVSVGSTASQMLKLATNEDIISKSSFADRENICRWLM